MRTVQMTATYSPGLALNPLPRFRQHNSPPLNAIQEATHAPQVLLALDVLHGIIRLTDVVQFRGQDAGQCLKMTQTSGNLSCSHAGFLWLVRCERSGS